MHEPNFNDYTNSKNMKLNFTIDIVCRVALNDTYLNTKDSYQKDNSKNHSLHQKRFK